MGLMPQGPGPAGSISHFATLTESGLRVVDVWETKEQFEKFAQEQRSPEDAVLRGAQLLHARFVNSPTRGGAPPGV